VKIAVSTICPHVSFEGRWWSYEPFVLEMNVWGQLFDELIMVAPVEEGPAPPFWAPYDESTKVRLVPYRKNKGRGLKQPRASVFEVPAMVSSIFKAARSAEAFHVRCPGNIGLLSALIAPVLHRRTCAKFAGQWGDYDGEPASVRLQKAILRSAWWRGPVTVYGRHATDSDKIVPFFSSSLSANDLVRAKAAAEGRSIQSPLRVLFVGRLSASKNVDLLLSAAALLRTRKIGIEYVIVGDGPEKEALESQARAQDLGDSVAFVGSRTFDKVLDCYEQADVLVLMSETEGWPKALAEAMAFGLVCIGSAQGLIPEMLGEGRGIVVPPGNVDALAAAIEQIAVRPESFDSMRLRASVWAQQYGLENLKNSLRELLAMSWNVSFEGESLAHV